MPDHRGRPSYSYDYDDYPGYASHRTHGEEGAVLLVGVLLFLWWVFLKLSSRETFSSQEQAAFKKVAKVRADLESVQATVSPKSGPPPTPPLLSVSYNPPKDTKDAAASEAKAAPKDKDAE